MGGFRSPMRSPSITAAAVDHAFLEPGMNARALNLDQYDPSPGIDSQLERIRALAVGSPPSPIREALIAEVDRAILSNSLEGGEILEICGDADQLVTDLRRGERRPGHQALGAKSIARALRRPLELSLSPAKGSVAELATERRRLREILAETPRLMLLSTAVEHELGHEKFSALLHHVNEKGAGRSAAAGAPEERGPAPHDGS